LANLTQEIVENWIQNEATGRFHYSKVLDGQIDPKLYHHLREIMRRCKKKGLISSDGADGWWRPVDIKLEEICWWDGNSEIGENIVLPLGLNKYCFIPVPSLIVVAGKYNVGKTAFCINLVNCNLEMWANRLDFYVSEGADMMKKKFEALNAYIPKPPPFKMFRRTQNFADIINPNNLSVIDYLRVVMDKPYAIGDALFAIFNKLEKGIAVVAMQKPPGERKLAFGGASTAFEPSLYIAMDKNVLSFEKIKVAKPTTIDLDFLKIQFRLKNGANFYDIHEVVEGMNLGEGFPFGEEE
jgi:hypothetical protein